MKTFIIIWLGQLVSLLGSGLSGFAVGVWVYQQTNSVSQYTFLGFLSTLPFLLFAPLAGIAADRWSRRRLMILSDSIAAISSLILLILFVTRNIQIWHIYVANFVNLTGNTFQSPAYIALSSQLVPEEQLGRAGGLRQIAIASSNLLSPMLAGVLLVIVQLQGILLIDIVTCLIAVIILLIVPLNNLRSARTTLPQKQLSSGKTMFFEGIQFLKERRELLWLFLFLMGANFLMGLVTILFTPLVLSVTTPNILGFLLSWGGIGMLLGGGVISIRGNSRHPINDLLNFTLLCGVCILAAGLKPSIVLYGICVFLFMFSIVIVDISGQVLVQRKVEPSFQGRIFALKSAMQAGMMCFAYLMSGLLADRIFEPLMATEGLLSTTIGQIIGTGQGRGIGLMFALAGGLTILATTIAYNQPRLRNIEKLPNWKS
ncbi:MAG: MFS transporter [Microcystaceae cyanobacterium]